MVHDMVDNGVDCSDAVICDINSVDFIYEEGAVCIMNIRSS